MRFRSPVRLRVVFGAVLAVTTLANQGSAEEQAKSDKVDAALRDLKQAGPDGREKALKFLARRPWERSDRRSRRIRDALKPFLKPSQPAEFRRLVVSAMYGLPLDEVGGVLLDLVSYERNDLVLWAVAEKFGKWNERPRLPWAAEVVRRYRRATDVFHRSSLLRILGSLWKKGDEEKLVRSRARSSRNALERASALCAMRKRDRGAVPVLRAALEASDPAVLVAVLSKLENWTGLDYGYDRPRWRAWLRQGKPFREEEWVMQVPEPPDELVLEEGPDGESVLVPKPPPADRNPPDHLSPTWYGVPVHGADSVFCVDVSASMRSKLPAVQRELEKSVRKLPPLSRVFNVVYFGGEVRVWRERFTIAHPIATELCIRHLRTVQVQPGRNLLEALERALDLRPDEIFLVSDGLPDRGRKTKPREVVAELKRINRANVAIHTVALTGQGQNRDHVALLRDIAKLTKARHMTRTIK